MQKYLSEKEINNFQNISVDFPSRKQRENHLGL
jgi:hypothetical protein